MVAVAFLLATAFWLLRTRSGKASRAISDNPALASASGIDVEKVINRVFICAPRWRRWRESSIAPTTA